MKPAYHNTKKHEWSKRAALLLCAALPLCAALGCQSIAPAVQAVQSALPEKETATAASPAAQTPDIKTPTAAPASPTPAPAAETPAPEKRTLYTMRLTADPDKGIVDGELQLDYVNTTAHTFYELVLRLWPNAMEPGCMKILGVMQEGADTFYKLSDDGSALYIPINHDLTPGAEASVSLHFSLTVPEREGRFGKNELGVMLGNAFPILAPMQNGEWRIDPYVKTGDPFTSERADYRVVIRCPLTYAVAATGTAGEAKIVDSTVFEGLYTASPARDFAVALVKDANPKTVDANGVHVTGYNKYKDRAAFLADTAASALSYFSERLGAYPYGDLSAVGTKLTGGMEYPGLVLIEQDRLSSGGTELGELYIAHEVAHQWFYNVIGTDAVMEPWVDEALVEFLSFDYIRSVHGADYTAQLHDARFYGMEEHVYACRMDAPLAEFDKAPVNEYVFGVYGRGYDLYGELYEKLGAEKFYATLKSLCASACDTGSVTGESLIAAFSEALGSDAAPIFEKHMAASPTPSATPEAKDKKK